MYILPEIVEKSKKMDLLTYLQNYDPDELVKVSNGTYCTRTHDSLIISNGLWHWFSRGIGGRSAVDYLIKVNGMSFQDAVVEVLEKQQVDNIVSVKKNEQDSNRVNRQLVLPPRANSNERVINYLVRRGISKEIIDYCIENNLIYEDVPYHNAVFVGYDKDNIARYGCVRSTSNSNVKYDVKGSDKHYSFKLVNKVSNTNTIHLFEGAIDVLSYATILKYSNKDWKQTNMLSLAGVYKTDKSKLPRALERYLIDNPSVNTIVLHLDRDSVGRSATASIKETLPSKYEVIEERVSKGKDVNEQLCNMLGRNKSNSKER